MMDTDERSRLRLWLAKQLKRGDVPDSLWSDLVEGYYVSEVIEGTSERDNLLKVARRKIRRSIEIANEWQGNSFPVRSRSEGAFATADHPLSTDRVSLSAYEEERGQAFLEYLAKMAEGEPVVQNFRRRILGREALTLEEARDLISSPALRFLSPSWLQYQGLPVLGNQVRIVGEERRPCSEFPEETDLIVQVELPDGRRETEEISIMTGQRPGVLTLPYGKGLPIRELFVWPGSVLDILRHLSIGLADYYAWQEEDAAWFVLTGEPPQVSPLSWSCRRYSERDSHWVIDLRVSSWISADTLGSFYRYLQRSRLRHVNRPLSKRNVAVFRFVVGHVEAHPDKMDVALENRRIPTSIIARNRTSMLGMPPWRTLLKLWNQAYPEWEYKDVRLFSRDFYRAHKVICQP